MKVELTFNPQNELTIQPENDWGDTQTFKVNLKASTHSGDYEIGMSAIQGFVGKKEGRITEHCEDPGVTEMYFPLTGLFMARRGGRTYAQVGPFSDLTMLEPQGTLDLSNPDKPVLVVKDKSGKEHRIEGFVIPPGTQHGTEHVPLPDTPCRFVAIKIKQPSQEEGRAE